MCLIYNSSCHSLRFFFNTSSALIESYGFLCMFYLSFIYAYLPSGSSLQSLIGHRKWVNIPLESFDIWVVYGPFMSTGLLIAGLYTMGHNFHVFRWLWPLESKCEWLVYFVWTMDRQHIYTYPHTWCNDLTFQQLNGVVHFMWKGSWSDYHSLSSGKLLRSMFMVNLDGQIFFENVQAI